MLWTSQGGEFLNEALGGPGIATTAYQQELSGGYEGKAIANGIKAGK